MTREEATAQVYENREAAVALIQQLVAPVERLTASQNFTSKKEGNLKNDNNRRPFT